MDPFDEILSDPGFTCKLYIHQFVHFYFLDNE